MLLSTSIRHFFRHKFPFLTIIWKKLSSVCNYVFYKYMCIRYHSDKKLAEYKGKCKGKRCFIIGNGPSLCAKDLNLLKNEDCFACNHIEKIYNQTDWRPKFYTIVDPYLACEIDLHMYKDIFMSSAYIRKHRQYIHQSVKCFHGINKWENGYPTFFEDITQSVGYYPTIVFANIQLAVYMGYEEIYILGVDHDFIYTIDTKDLSAIKKGNAHFYDNNNRNSKYENNPADVDGLNKAYYAAKEYCDNHNIIIKNVTRGGKLEVFERDTLEHVLSSTCANKRA